MTQPVTLAAFEPSLERLASLGRLGYNSLGILQTALRRPAFFSARQEMQHEGWPIVDCRLVISGWAARVRFLQDGRRQLLSFVLPGDLIGFCEHQRAVAVSTVIALTPLELCVVPTCDAAPDLLNVMRTSRAIDEACLLAQITRLGRLSAQERLCDLFLELHERLRLCGLADISSFPMPLTQEMLADALGLTTVHLNRMVQQARKSGDLAWKGGRITFHDPVELARKVGRVATRVAAQPEEQASAFSFAT